MTMMFDVMYVTEIQSKMILHQNKSTSSNSYCRRSEAGRLLQMSIEVYWYNIIRK